MSFVTDERGSVLLIVATSGSVEQTYNYEVFGSVTASWTTLGWPTGPQIGFEDGIYDSTTGLLRFGARSCANWSREHVDEATRTSGVG